MYKKIHLNQLSDNDLGGIWRYLARQIDLSNLEISLGNISFLQDNQTGEEYLSNTINGPPQAIILKKQQK